MTNTDDELIPSDELILAQGIGKGQFRNMGDSMVGRFRRLGFVEDCDTVVDIGCGLGRLARPFTSFLSLERGGRYYGFDINKGSVEWVRERYARFPNFHFEWMNLKSIYYNKDGRRKSRDYAFPLRDNLADFIFLTSVFTHMFTEDAAGYLREISRMLKPGGRCYITYFLIDDDDESWCAKRYHRIRDFYVQDLARPEAVVLLNRTIVLDLYRQAGLEVETISYGNWAGTSRKHPAEVGLYQDEIIAVKAQG